MNPLRQPFRYRYDGVILWLIGINALVFFLTRFFGRGILAFYLAMVPELVREGWVWTFVTYMFLHAGFSHIFFNMFALFLFGTQVERQMGSREFLLFYFVTGILAGVFSFMVYTLTGANEVFLMGASGAIFAVQLAYAVFFPDAIVYLWGILPLRAPVMVLGFTALELVSQIFGPLGPGSGGGGSGRPDKVAHLTHLAGFGVAWFYFLIRFGINPWRRLFRR